MRAGKRRVLLAPAGPADPHAYFGPRYRASGPGAQGPSRRTVLPRSTAGVSAALGPAAEHEPVVHDTADRGMSDGWDFRIAMCFVPDAEHLWEVVEKFTGDGK